MENIKASIEEFFLSLSNSIQSNCDREKLAEYFPGKTINASSFDKLLKNTFSQVNLTPKKISQLKPFTYLVSLQCALKYKRKNSGTVSMKLPKSFTVKIIDGKAVGANPQDLERILDIRLAVGLAIAFTVFAWIAPLALLFALLRYTPVSDWLISILSWIRK